MNRVMPVMQAAAVAILVTIGTATGADTDHRTLVMLPAPMQEHMLGNMRDHLQTLDQINRALAEGRWNDAATVAEQRLGVSSLAAHGAEHMAPFMPKPMQAIGTAMHRAATEFAVHATEGDLRQSVQQLAEITRQCVACHAAYRIR
jgi:hypothetical protein